MKDDDEDESFARSLGRAVRDERAGKAEETLAGWAEGKLDRAEAERRLQQQGGGGGGLAELAAPLSDGLAARIAEDGLRRVRGEAAAPATGAGANGSAGGGTVIPLLVRRRRLLGGVGTVALAAAAAWVFWPRVSLPGYQLSVEGGDRPDRSSGAPFPGVLSADSQLTLVLQPDTPVDGRVEARLYAAAPGGAPAVAPGVAAVAPSGAVRWTGTARELLGGRYGELELIAVVGRAGALPGPGELGSAATPARAPTWRQLRTTVRVLPADAR